MLLRARILAPDTDANPLLSRRLRRLSTLLLLGLSGFALIAASVTPQAREWVRARLGLSAAPPHPPAKAAPLQTGRASCWERVCQIVLVPVVAASFKTKT